MPLVSVVTPFYNTAPYLREAIESVLSQTLGDFEYLLVDNKSSDGSRDIATEFAARDSRIRLLENDAFLGQVENYNGALARIDPNSEFVKIVQADDAIFPDCLRLMVETAQRDRKIGIVSSYYLKGNTPRGSGVPYNSGRAGGREILRGMMFGTGFPFGSPTTSLYRSDVVRSRQPFYALGRYHEDTEAACEILLEHDLGFVHQILSFCRTENESIMSGARRFSPETLDHLIILERYGRDVLTAPEFERQSTAEWRAYLGFLGAGRLDRREPEFWEYHRRGLATIGRQIETRQLLLPTLRQLARRTLNPSQVLDRVLGQLRARRSR